MATAPLIHRIFSGLVAVDASLRSALGSAPIPGELRPFLHVTSRVLRGGDGSSSTLEEQRAAIRAAFIAMPATECAKLPASLLDDQEALLAAELAAAGVVEAEELPRLSGSRFPVAVWQGDMSRLRCDCVVNPANSNLLGCFLPTHRCLDNILHAQAGPRLRIACLEQKAREGIDQTPNGRCMVTPAFAMPCRCVYHTVGPNLCDHCASRNNATARAPTPTDRSELQSCYTEVLEQSKRDGMRSVAFCCISTGIFAYPADEACELACETVRAWFERTEAEGAPLPLVVFNVFKDEDLALYHKVAPAVFGERQ